MTPASTLVGQALYLEFRKGVNTAQIFITPEGITSSGDYVPSSSWRRQISNWSPKKPWKCYPNGDTTSRKEVFESSKSLVSMTDVETAKAVVTSQYLDTLLPILNLLQYNNWELLKTPIVLEFSQEDLENTQKWETPSALIRRVLRARKELGFPDELIEKPAE